METSAQENAQAAVLPPRKKGNSAAGSAQSEGSDSSGGAGRLSPGNWYNSSVVALAVVLGAIVVVTYLARRYVPAVRKVSGGGLKLLHRTYISPKQSLAVVQVGRRLLLVGITSEQITRLADIDDPQDAAMLMSTAPAPSPTSKRKMPFSRLLSKAGTRFDSEHAETEIERRDVSQRIQDARGSLEGTLDKLRKMQAQ